MFINKIGQHHLEFGENCQDAGIYKVYMPEDNPYSNEEECFNVHKLVCDGCGEGKHSEVGAKLYTLLNKAPIVDLNTALDSIVRLLTQSSDDKSLFMPMQKLKINPQVIKDYCCFTILDVWDMDDLEYPEDSHFLVYYCGDGYIITQDHDDDINFIKLDDGDYPKYMAYNYLDKEHLSQYKEGVSFERESYNKSEFKNVGVASDGIRFILNHEDKDLVNEFTEILKSGKENRMKRFINKHQQIFKDDVTISF